MEDYLSSTNYMRRPLFSEAIEDHEYDDTCSQESGWDFLVDLIANNCESSLSFSCGYDQTSSSLVSHDDNVVDEELEDTASSPLQSPKLADLNYLYTKSKEAYSEENHQVKGHATQEAREVGIGFIETELRRKGLCLVPISMLMSFS